MKRAVLVGDLPYKTYETPKQAVESARQLIDDGADAVKLEGGREVEPQLRALIDDGIPIIGHLGMLPQRIQEEGRYRKKGKSEDEAARLLDDAQLLDKLGVKAMVLESMFKRVAREITAAVSIPTIGIGAGNGCDGQILVTHDLIGAFPWFCPPFAIPKANVAESISQAVSAYVEDVRTSHD